MGYTGCTGCTGYTGSSKCSGTPFPPLHTNLRLSQFILSTQCNSPEPSPALPPSRFIQCNVPPSLPAPLQPSVHLRASSAPSANSLLPATDLRPSQCTQRLQCTPPAPPSAFRQSRCTQCNPHPSLPLPFVRLNASNASSETQQTQYSPPLLSRAI